MTESEQPEGEFSAQASTSADPMLGKELREGLQNWTKLLRQFAENYMAVAEAFRPVATQLAQQIKARSGQIAPFLAQITEAAGQIAPILAEIKEAAEHL